ncbi:hypothetical protein HNQ94_000542 [Salirhabdus euzebyi]|uniref:Amidohydrolase 3 domain-containing protein n=1 Tax=Salirhabdus euzebyi TaxID=394506 RepID=A0A841PYM6_9BACI|nr:amidohydrolase [Salirhabdus euzebyi]MBB6452121.1 hypothetical protein [Salirhabdus euzebyi]
MGKLWFGGSIYTMRMPNEMVEAVYSENGKVMDMGLKQELENKYKDNIEEYVDIEGQVMYPGFIDSHLHIVGHGERILRLDLAYTQSPKELLESIKKATSNLAPGEWLVGEGFNENQWDDPRIIHRKELDEIAPDHPVMLTRICRHAIVANSKALEMAGVDHRTEAPFGGVIAKDEDGSPTGFLLDTAQDLIKNAMPTVTDEYIEKAINVSIHDLLAKGIVAGHTEDLNYYGGFDQTYQAFCRTIDGEKIKFRAHLLVHHGVIEDMEKAGLGFKRGTKWVELGAMKIFADGALGGRTAWLSEPYEDDPMQVGVPIHSETQMSLLMEKARSLQMPVAIHAIGDKAVEFVVDMLEKFPPPSGVKDRIIHAQIMREELYERINKSNTIIDIQPTFVSSDFPWVMERIGERRLQHAYPWKSFLERGIICAGGSDAPIEEVNPLKGIEAAIIRKSIFDGNSYGLEQALSIYEAIALYTINAAAAIGNEHIQGQIAPGFYADFTILNKDLFKIEPSEISSTSVLKTVVDETIVYRK